MFFVSRWGGGREGHDGFKSGRPRPGFAELRKKGLTYASNPIMARTTARMRKAIKIQTPVDLKKDSLS